jgi:hypothetical protein
MGPPFATDVRTAPRFELVPWNEVMTRSVAWNPALKMADHAGFIEQLEEDRASARPKVVGPRWMSWIGGAAVRTR